MDTLSSLLWIALTFLVLWISYKYFTAPENPWKKAGVPVLSRWESLFSAINFNLFPLHLRIQQNYKKYGKIFGLYSYGSTMLYTGDPELIRLILVKDFQHFMNRLDAFSIGDPVIESMMSIAHGEQWKRIRNATTPTFSTGKIKKMTSIILDCIETLTKNFDKEASLKTPTDVKRFTSAFTMDVISSTAFGTKIDSLNDLDSPFMKVLSKMLSRTGQIRMIFLMSINGLMTSLHLKPLNISLFGYFEKLAKNIIEERKKSGLRYNDFLQLMLDASTSNLSITADKDIDDQSSNGKIDKETPLQNNQSQDNAVSKEHKGLNEHEMLAQCIMFLIGGFETIASTITFALYELALNEHIQDDLISEIDEVLRLNQKELTYENVQNMKYIENVVYETLRKYPPGTITQRFSQTDYKVGDSDLVIPKGAVVVIPVYAMHHDEAYFPNPETFDPNRFTAEEKARRDPYVYLPFGAGPRNCVAMRFALFEVKLCLAALLSRYRFRRCPKTKVPLKFPMAQPQLVAKDIFLAIEKREDLVV